MTIYNTDDVIDSREIIERIEELTNEGGAWAIIVSLPGCLPDGGPEYYAEWADARDRLADTIDEAADYAEESAAHAPDEKTRDAQRATAAECRETAAEVRAHNPATPGDVNAYAAGNQYTLTTAHNRGLSDEDFTELVALENLASQCEGYGDWEYGETLIRDSYFIEYTEELISNCYEIPKALNSGDWPYRHIKIDYEAAADELKEDYTEVDFDGETYWIRG